MRNYILSLAVILLISTMTQSFTLLATNPIKLPVPISQKTITTKQKSTTLESKANDQTVSTQKVSFVFKMDYSQAHAIPLTGKDAQKLRKFLIYSNEMLSCNASEKSVISQNKQDQEVILVKVVDEIQTAGYQVNELVCSDKNITFSISKLNQLCSDCGHVEVSQTLTDKFKNADYGGELIDLGFEKPEEEDDDDEGFSAFDMIMDETPKE